jgi:para-nitrobenzyl esterase
MTSNGPVFTPPSGPVRGWLDGDVLRATGIRYAVAQRFRPPTAAPDHVDVVDADTWSAPCPQHVVPLLDRVLGDGHNGVPVDEHCQRLSVTMPVDVDPDERLPVMVWIHGGSYTAGSGDSAFMDPRPIVAEQRVVVVTVTYRLGLFGYLGDGADRAANLGLLDQLEAFRWVRRNIGAFGGDPDRVTAFGQSAGGDAVAHLMAVPAAAGLFHRAIVQSAPLGIARGRAGMNAAMAAATSDVDEHSSVEQVLAAETRAEASARGEGLRGAMPFGTQYGHDPLPAEAEVEAAWDRAAPGVDLLIGRTSEEARLFLARLPLVHRASALPVVGPALRRALVGAVTRRVYGAAADRFARRHREAGGRATEYVITWAAPGNPYGAAHTIDLPLLFGDRATWADAGLVAGAAWEDLDAAGRSVRRIWADFARGTAPTPRDSVRGTVRIR